MFVTHLSLADFRSYPSVELGLEPGVTTFTGANGQGKTNLVEAMADVCFEDRRAMLKIDCAEFSHSHEIARLVGSPPGYLGHQETNPYLSSSNVLRYQTADCPLTLLLFDEIEKANDALWQLLLGVLDKARLTLGTNKEVDLSTCFIFLTSNIGSRSVSEILAPPLGFATGSGEPDARVHQRIEDAVLWKARRTFSPEFLNRLDDIVIFHSLTRAHIRQVVELQVEHVRALLAERRVGLVLSDAALDLLAEEGYDPHFGARPLKRTIQRKLQNPLAMQLLEGAYHPGDLAEVGVTHGALTFRAVKGDPVHA